MGLSIFEQIKETVEKSNTILIATAKKYNTDAIAASLALAMFLEKQNKRVKVVCAGYNLLPAHNFLPKSEEIVSDLTSLRKFIISLDVKKNKVEELSYDIKDDKLNIYITPKSGFYEERDISTSSGGFAYDLIFALNTPDLDSLDQIYEENREFFYQKPIINIDHNPENEYYGQVNHVDLTATSISEIVFDLLKHFREELIDEHIATNLLTGIISKTKSFQSPQVTPRTLSIASHLIASGARREEIVKNLYRTKSISTLKLWGRALARLRADVNNRVVWTIINKEDFDKSQAKERDLRGVIDELIINTPEAKIVFILYEKGDNHVYGIVSTEEKLDALEVLKRFNPKGTKDFTEFVLKNKTLEEAEKIILEDLRKNI
jgi:nanoRNase/pAp phosphatase (c-di-AMP/oligoRNAs hydrolase)